MYHPLFFDERKFQEKLADCRSKLTVFRDAIQAANTQFDNRFLEGEQIRRLVNERAGFIDRILHYAWQQYSWGNDIALLAVGGYGREELHPHSDIDLLILLEARLSEKQKDSIERFVAFLWDLNLNIGHSVRSVEECVAVAADDITIATNLLECRTLEGPATLQQKLKECIKEQHIWPSKLFFKAKWDEQLQRHAKHNNTEYNLEPNIKNAPGGLRDIQTIAWVAKRYFGVQRMYQLVGKNSLLTESEYNILTKGEELLWQIRYGLHYLAKRPEDRLLFEHQRQLAELFGYKDNDESLAVEQFMKRYYRVVMALQELNDVLLNYLDETILKADQPDEIEVINERFQIHNGSIEVRKPDIFQQHPSALLEIFVLMGKSPEKIRGVRASTIRLIRDNRHLINEDFCRQPENTSLFMALMRIEKSLVTQLKRMKRYGILGRYLPEFGRIIGQMQHDLFHIYTVDAHTILVIKNLRRFSHPDAEDNFPIAAHIVKRLPKIELLYIAGLFHDIGKGLGGDHSELGADIAREFCELHDFSKRDANLVCWLVEKHLLMSTVSQRQDISDPEVIHNFALEMGDQLHLDYLYTLTVADINATNPDLWTSWKASLIRQLYLETKRALRRGLENPTDKQEWIEESQRSAMEKLLKRGFTQQQVESIWQHYTDDYFMRESDSDIVWHTQAILNHHSDKPLILISKPHARGFESATQIFIRTRSRDNVFAAIVTTLDTLNLNIQDARLYDSRSGFTNDTFYVLDENDLPLGDDLERIELVRSTLEEELCQLDDNYPEIIQRRTPRQLKQFAMPTRTSISNDINSGNTVLEVISPDRPGLLARIAHVFVNFRIRLLYARIATLGERVEDVFFITNLEGQPLSDPELCRDLQNAIKTQLDKQFEPETTAITF